MQDLISSKSNDEIDLKELFISLWAYKLFIAGVCVLCIILAGNYASNKDRKFSSEAIFRLGKTKRNAISLNNSLDAISSISGLMGNATKISNLKKDQVTSRVFIEKLDAKLNFHADSYFNSYDPNAIDPNWVSTIKRTLGWKKYPIDAQEAIWQSIIKKYTDNVFLDETSEGSIKINVTHKVPERAAEIANEIMDTIITNTQEKNDKQQDQMLNYLSNTLAKALNDLEKSQSDLKEFALKNSALPLENFTAGSVELDVLREQLSRSSELYEAVAALSSMLQNKATGQDDYNTLRQRFPIIDEVEFRRVLGQNEIISSWSWPEANSVDAVLETLSERKKRLQSQIKASQKDAESSSVALENYAKLERKAKIAEAAYTVLIEQVKAQSMAAGYRPDEVEVYEYASVSIKSSEPNQIAILGLGTILGLFMGSSLSLILARRRGVYFSKEYLKAGAQARLTANVRAILPFRKKSLDDLNTMLIKKPRSDLRDMAIEIHKSDTKQVVVTSSRAKLTGNDAALALASYMQSDSMKIAVIDFSSKEKTLSFDEKNLSIGSFVITESNGNLLILRPNANLAAVELLNQKDFIKNMHSLNSTIDLLFLCADDHDAISLLRALQGQNMFHITLARTKYTKSTELLHMSSLLPIQGLFHD